MHLGVTMSSKWKIIAVLAVSISALLSSTTFINNQKETLHLSDNQSSLMLFIFTLLILLLSTFLNLSSINRLNKKQEKLNKTSLELTKSNKRLHAILDATNESIIYTNNEGIIEDSNKVTEEIFGYKKNELIGNNIDILLPDSIKKKHKSYLDDSNIHSTRVLGENRRIYCRHKCGRKIPVEITITKIQIDNKVKYIGTIRDVSELLKEREELKKALKREEILGIKKNQLLSSASHELRTPLNAIIGFTNLLIANNSTNTINERIEQLKDIETSAELLLLLVNDLLCFTKINNGDIGLQNSNFSLNTLINECIKIKSTEIHGKNIHITTHNMDPLMIRSDKLRIKQILINLISNAIKYGHDYGHIEIKSTKQNNMLFISIKDDGIGIANDKSQLLFTPFTRLHTNLNHIEGSGIGLSLCKNIANHMGGDISYKENHPRGSIFTLSIPATEITDTSCKEEVPTDIEKTNTKILRQAKLLYVEDNIVNIRLMKAILEKHGIELHQVESGEECLDYIQDNPVDLILMDINLPNISGIETAAIIKSNFLLSHIPIIAVSASITQHHKTKQNYFIDSISKPFKPDRLVSTIDSTLTKHLQTDEDLV